MIVYEADKKQFLFDNDHRDIEEVVLERFLRATGHPVGRAELLSWRHSLASFARVLRDEDLPQDMGVAVELHIPQSSKRIDVTLTGFDHEGAKQAVIIELKQWEHAAATPKDAIVLTYLGHGEREVVHPSYQAWSYATLLRDFNEAVHSRDIAISPCAYLHNYRRDGVLDAAHYAEHLARAPLFLKGEGELKDLRGFIKHRVRRGDGGAVLHELVNGRMRPSKALADSLSLMLRGNPEFVLIDDQKQVYEAALAAAREATDQRPRVLIVEGGPGTGKTVLAINLLVALTGMGLNTRYVSKNAAPRRVYESRLAGTIRRTRFAELFKSSGAFVDAAPNAFDVLLVDEAHRLNEKSGLYGNLGEHQVKELIRAARCTVFFLDEDQRVALQDVGTRQLILDFARDRPGVQLGEMALASQFRCSGSDGYIAWLDHVLGIRETANPTLDAGDFEFRVFDTPQELHAAIAVRNTHNKARVVAGYCWPWVSRKDPAAHDIAIGDQYRRRWNLDKDGALWIIAPDSIDEVGCIHTCQGLELDYVGVIIGPDLSVHGGQVLTHPAARAPQDRTLRGYRRLARDEPLAARAQADLIIKNTYRTLMTRGMKGCFVYCTDEATREYLRRHLGSPNRVSKACRGSPGGAMAPP